MKKLLACLMAALLAFCVPLCAGAWELNAGTQNFIANPLRGTALSALTVEYTIVWPQSAGRTGDATLLAFSDAGAGAFVCFQSAPFVSLRGGAALDIGCGASYAQASCQNGTAYTFQWTITAGGASVRVNGASVGALAQSGGGTCADLLSAVSQADYFFIGVGRGRHSSDWSTESCTLTDVRVNGQLITF